jgi:uncharacterized protein YbjT (DUF2867 family)
MLRRSSYELAVVAGVRHVVKLSQFAADEASPVRFLRYHAAVERGIRELGIGFTFLRPNLYFPGLLAFQPMIAKDGHFVAPIGDARVSAVDVRDIAAIAAVALTEEGHEGKTYTITGPAAVTTHGDGRRHSGSDRTTSNLCGCATPSVCKCIGLGRRSAVASRRID